MKVLSIGTDKKLFEKGSSVASRSIEYGKLIGSLHILVFTLKKQKFSKISLSDCVTVYPTNSVSRWFFVSDAVSMGKKIISQNKFPAGDSVVTCQDPFECGFVGWRLSGHFHLPLHLQIHTDFLSPYFQTSYLNRLRVSTAKFLLPRADFVRAVSLRIADSLKDSGLKLRHPIRILPIRIDAETVFSESSEKKKIRTSGKCFHSSNS